MHKLLWSVIIISAFYGDLSFAWLNSNDAGTASAPLFKISVDSRATAMGEAQTALDNGVNSIFWNPAGLATTGNMEAGMGHVMWFENVSIENLGIAYPTNYGVLAAAFQYLYMTPISKYDATGNKLEESFSPHDMVAIIGYGYDLGAVIPSARLAAGVNAKYINSSLDSETAYALAGDAGVRCLFPDYHFSAGIAVQNLGTSMKYMDAAAPLPAAIRLGTAYSFFPLTCALDFIVPSDDEIKIGLGAEYVFRVGGVSLAPRLGYKFSRGLQNSGGLARLAAGAGINFMNFQLDYAWAPLGDLGDAHRLGLIYTFSNPEPQALKALLNNSAISIKSDEPRKINRTTLPLMKKQSQAR